MDNAQLTNAISASGLAAVYRTLQVLTSDIHMEHPLSIQAAAERVRMLGMPKYCLSALEWTAIPLLDARGVEAIPDLCTLTLEVGTLTADYQMDRIIRAAREISSTDEEMVEEVKRSLIEIQDSAD